MRPDATTSNDNRGPIDHLVIVGNGMAAHRLVATLVDKPHAPRRITILGEESSPAYNRILLSPWLAGEMDHAALRLPDYRAATQGDTRIDIHLDERVTDIDPQARRLTTDRGTIFDYDRLVLATGSSSAMPSVPGIELEGVQGFRDMRDAERLAQAAEQGGHAVVIGGGLLGLEAAEGLRKRGMAVTVVHRSAHLMNRQLDTTAANLLQDELASRGLRIITEGHLQAIESNARGQAQAVHLDDGTRLQADRVVVAIGISPNVELGRSAGLACENAILVDEHLRSSDPSIHALGECCQFGSSTYGLVEPIWQQVDVLSAILCAEKPAGFEDRPTATKLKISGVSLYAFGPITAAPEHDVLTYHDPEHGEYRRLLMRGDRLEGAILYGDTAMGPWLFAHAQQDTPLGPARRALLLGQADADTLLDADTSPSTTHAFDQEAA